MEGGERWPVIAWAMPERPVVIRAIRDEGVGDDKVKEKVDAVFFQSFRF